MTTITLKRPITAHGEEVTKVTLRDLEAGDIIVCGYPLQINDGGATPIAGAVAKYIERLGNLPASAIKKMHPADFSACLQVIIGFFGDTDGSPASGG
ncbi:MAG TPA: phage tail assembly protein [Kaistia sp.]|jgi:predicted ThiF/HesA family dinucleotide-utilizing enzyme|nr:phage tail assembly protein [Kaistia sp.]